MTDDPHMSRRGFLRGRFLGAISAGLDGVRLRGFEDNPRRSARTPIGRDFNRSSGRAAVPEQQFLDGCTRCNACIEACPHDAIVLAPSRLREAAGTPMIDPHKQPCWMCHDTPCVTACEPRVLDPLRLQWERRASIRHRALLIRAVSAPSARSVVLFRTRSRL